VTRAESLAQVVIRAGRTQIYRCGYPIAARRASVACQARRGHKLIICAVCDLYDWFVAGGAAEGDADAEVAFGGDGVG
jgi:hypothetical protein